MGSSKLPDLDYSALAHRINTDPECTKLKGHEKLAALIKRADFRDCLGKWLAGYLQDDGDYSEQATKWYGKARESLMVLQSNWQSEGHAPLTMALGYEGAMLQPSIQKMIKNGTLIQGNLHQYATGHSYMKVPNDKVKEHGYQYYMMNGVPGKGIESFGAYDKSQFPKRETNDG